MKIEIVINKCSGGEMSFTECCNLRFIGDNHSPIQPDGYCLHCGFHPEIKMLKEEKLELQKKLDDKREYIKQLRDKNLSLTELIEPMSRKIDEKDEEIEALKTKLNTCKNDYWFMINLIEKYGSNKEQTLKDCLERMKFRKHMFNFSENPNSSKEGV